MLAMMASGARAVNLYALKKSDIGISVVSSSDLATMMALVAMKTGFKSEIGEAVAKFPAGVPTFLIWRPAKYLSCLSMALKGCPLEGP